MIRAELHCHSEYSRDCAVSLPRLIEICKRRNLQAIALTDHNEIEGALRLKEMAPAWLHVIVGEEVATRQGDLIGLCLTKRIPAGLDIEETIGKIREQRGLVLLPHPFDRLRKEAVGEEVVERVASLVDFIEVFNGRCVFPQDNWKARRYAKEHAVPGFVGSDAHTPSEYGRSVMQMEAFTTAGELKKSLQEASFICRYTHPFVHVSTKLTKLKKKHSL